MAFKITVDTGGTFTDVVVSDDKGVMVIGKALTTPTRAFKGVSEAIQSAATQMGLSFEALLTSSTMFIYGTTRATNAIVTKTAAKTAFVTTAGFPDILSLKEGGKHNPHDFSQDYPPPYIPRRYTFELEERIDVDGAVALPFDEDQAYAVITRIRELNIEAVAVCLLWSIKNSVHEEYFGHMLDEHLPYVPYTLSHKLIPVIREYRRASATAIDASLKPLMQDHLRALQEDLRNAGYRGEVLVATTEGGCNQIEALVEKPIYTVGSGPAMAPIAGLTFSQLEGLGEDVIICDTGGTTFDVGLVRDGRPMFTRDTWLGSTYTGDILGISAVDMRSIGAGGGSIAWIDDGGLMRVGPQSAGADPGPACYGRGGTLPTVTDAAVVLGYFDPEYFLGGRMTLDEAAARRVIGEFAERISATAEQVAYQILSLASDLMMRAIYDITILQGINPRESTLVAGGGAAGLNIMLIAKELGCQRIILPKLASALSAAGMQFADIVREETASLLAVSSHFDAETVNELLDTLEKKLDAFNKNNITLEGGHSIEFVAEARYQGQVWELDTPLPVRRFQTENDLASFIETFHQLHERVFAVRDPDSPVEIVSWKARLVVRLRRERPTTNINGGEAQASLSMRDCYFGEAKASSTKIYKPENIFPGLEISGPAIIEEPTTTLVVYPGMYAKVSAIGNYLLSFS